MTRKTNLEFRLKSLIIAKIIIVKIMLLSLLYLRASCAALKGARKGLVAVNSGGEEEKEAAAADSSPGVTLKR